MSIASLCLVLSEQGRRRLLTVVGFMFCEVKAHTVVRPEAAAGLVFLGFQQSC